MRGDKVAAVTKEPHKPETTCGVSCHSSIQMMLAATPPATVRSQSVQSHGLPCSLSFSSRHDAATTAEYMAPNAEHVHNPTTKPPARCFHRLLSFKKEIILFIMNRF